MGVASNLSDQLYIITLRVTQPARVQDIFVSLREIFGDEINQRARIR